MPNLDLLIIRAFTSTGSSVDRIACFGAIRRRILDHLRPLIQDVNDENIVWRLFQLRKLAKLPPKEGGGLTNGNICCAQSLGRIRLILAT
jgi:hypothetical protein